MTLRRSLPLLLAATAVSVVVPGPTAHAVTPSCADDEVTVLVSPPAGDDALTCVPGDRQNTAGQLFERAGHDLVRVQRFPGAVCRVDEVPAEDPCIAMPPEDRYWGFFHDDGDGWEYATIGVDGVQPEAGEAVALVWQSTADVVPPGERTAAASSSPPQEATPRTSSQDQGLPLAVPLVAVGGVALAGAVLLVRRRRS